MNTKDELCRLTKQMWDYYLLDPTEENFARLFGAISDDLVFIGTGKHEFYTDFGQTVESLSSNRKIAENIRFDVLDEWYECREIAPDVYLVYGGLWARQKAEPDVEVQVDMDTRFSVVYRREKGQWKIVHLHHSMPYADQRDGEFYPKSISDRMNEALALARLFQKRAELDLMTSVYNHESFRQRVQDALAEAGTGTLFLFDLDCFKEYNDSYGHAEGDALLKAFAGALRSIFPEAMIGRMGGDEFAVFAPSPVADDSAAALVAAVASELETSSTQPTATFSTGIARPSGRAHSFSKLFREADKALYEAKNNGKNSVCFYA